MFLLWPACHAFPLRGSSRTARGWGGSDEDTVWSVGNDYCFTRTGNSLLHFATLHRLDGLCLRMLEMKLDVNAVGMALFLVPAPVLFDLWSVNECDKTWPD